MIKFRAWDKKNKWMCHVGELYLPRDDFENGAVIDVYPLKDEDIKDLDDPWYEIIQPNFVLIQNTGLKDKNGKEIYEGDIVQTKNKFDKVVQEREITFGELVDYNEGYKIKVGIGFNIHNKDKGCFEYTEEVIGNIYENPNLLIQ